MFKRSTSAEDMSDLVVYSVDQFFSIQSKVGNLRTLDEKAEFMRSSFACFQDHAEPSKKWGKHEAPQKIARPDKLRIGTRELSREHIARKDFLALMNKLSDANKLSILQTLKQVFREDCLDVYMQVTWDHMQRAPEFHALYMSVLKTVSNILAKPNLWREKWHLLWKDYVMHQQWRPSDQLLQEEDYDEFCDFVKWRKRTIASINAWKLLEQHQWVQGVHDSLLQTIINACNDELTLTNGSKLADVLLDEIHALMEGTPPTKWMTIESFVKKWMQDPEQLRPSSRFKLYDLYERFTAKVKLLLDKGRTTHGSSRANH